MAPQFTSSAQTLLDDRFVVRVEAKARGQGSGVVISPRWVLTCWHVLAAPRRGLRPGVLFEGSMQSQCPGDITVLVKGRRYVVEKVVPLEWDHGGRRLALDAVLLFLEKALVPAASCAKFLIGVNRNNWGQLSENSICAIGKYAGGGATIPLTGRDLSSPYFRIPDGTLEAMSLNIRAVHGFSGGPVCTNVNGEVMCVAIIALGGDTAATSVAISADAIFAAIQNLDGGPPVDMDTVSLESIRPHHRGAPGFAIWGMILLVALCALWGAGTFGNIN